MSRAGSCAQRSYADPVASAAELEPAHEALTDAEFYMHVMLAINWLSRKIVAICRARIVGRGEKRVLWVVVRGGNGRCSRACGHLAPGGLRTSAEL